MSSNGASFARDWVVLLIDDMPDNLVVAQLALKYHGAQVYTAANGQDGLDLLEQIRPTVILLDIRMPTMDGWTMFEILRSNPATSDIPVIAVTAYAMDSDRERILNTGFDGYLSKPFDVVTFVADIAGVLNGRQHAG